MTGTRKEYGTNPVLRFMQKFGYLMALNILFIVFSIPIVTFGAALCALYYTLCRIIEGQETEIFRTFLRGFSENLFRGTVMGLAALLLGRIYYLELQFLLLMPSALGPSAVCGLWCLFSFGCLVSAFLFLYFFPLQARFRGSFGKIIADSFLLSIRHLPRTVLLLVSDGAITAAAVWFLLSVPAVGIVPWTVLVPLICMVNALYLRDILSLRGEENGQKAGKTEGGQTWKKAHFRGRKGGETDV